MLNAAHAVIRSNAPSIVQAISLFSIIPVLANSSIGDVVCKAHAAMTDLNIWLRRPDGRDRCVNNVLAQAVGMKPQKFVGLTYESSGLDPSLVPDRLETDRLVMESREIVVVREMTRFGLMHTINAPVVENGEVKGLIHLSAPLDISQCLKKKVCQGRLYAAPQ